MRYRRKCSLVVRVEDQPGDFVFLVGNDGLVEKADERKFGQRHARSHALSGGARSDACKHIARAQWCGFRQQVLEVGKAPGGAADGMRVANRFYAVGGV